MVVDFEKRDDGLDCEDKGGCDEGRAEPLEGLSKAKSMAGSRRKRVVADRERRSGRGGAESYWEFEGEAGSEKVVWSSSARRQACEQKVVPLVCRSQDKQKSPKQSIFEGGRADGRTQADASRVDGSGGI
jgi:hypothetical protein